MKKAFLCALTFLSVSLLSSCVVKPEFTESYDEKCTITKQRVELTVEELELFKGLQCSSNHECKAEFLAHVTGAALILPVSAIVSGSIAVVGNSIFWLKEQGQCPT